MPQNKLNAFLWQPVACGSIINALLFKTMDRKKAIAFLKGHFRYSTMNSWNLMTSYASNVKLHNLNIPEDLYDIAYEAIGGEDVYNCLSWIISDFKERHGQNYTIGFNGRNSGYMVLYECEVKESGHKSYCTTCGQRNFKTIEETGGARTCGACGKETRMDFKTPPKTKNVFGRGIDEDMDFEEMDDDELQARYDLITDFDKTIEEYRLAFIDYLKAFKEGMEDNDYKGLSEYWETEMAEITDKLYGFISYDEDFANSIVRNLHSIKASIAKKLE